MIACPDLLDRMFWLVALMLTIVCASVIAWFKLIPATESAERTFFLHSSSMEPFIIC